MGGEVNERVLKDVDIGQMKISALELPTPPPTPMRNGNPTKGRWGWG
jgi:hypothetical protein